jgi:hypothetical protein
MDDAMIQAGQDLAGDVAWQEPVPVITLDTGLGTIEGAPGDETFETQLRESIEQSDSQLIEQLPESVPSPIGHE